MGSAVGPSGVEFMRERGREVVSELFKANGRFGSVLDMTESECSARGKTDVLTLSFAADFRSPPDGSAIVM